MGELWCHQRGEVFERGEGDRRVGDGLGDADALAMYRSLWSYTLGSVLTSATATNRPAAATERKINAPGAEHFPHLAAALQGAITVDHRAAYHRGVLYLIDGFAR